MERNHVRRFAAALIAVSILSSSLSIFGAVPQEVMIPITQESIQTTVAPSAIPELKATHAIGSPGDTVNVDISVANNPGFAFGKIIVNYPSEYLKLASKSEANGILSGIVFNDEYDTQPFYNTINALWVNAADEKRDGKLFTLQFIIKANAPPGTMSLRITSEFTNQNWQNVIFSNNDGAIEVLNFTYGDINRDHTVAIDDVVYLLQVLAGWDNPFTANQKAAADVYPDGIIDAKDAVYFMQYLTQWPGVILGQFPNTSDTTTATTTTATTTTPTTTTSTTTTSNIVAVEPIFVLEDGITRIAYQPAVLNGVIYVKQGQLVSAKGGNLTQYDMMAFNMSGSGAKETDNYYEGHTSYTSVFYSIKTTAQVGYRHEISGNIIKNSVGPDPKPGPKESGPSISVYFVVIPAECEGVVFGQSGKAYIDYGNNTYQELIDSARPSAPMTLGPLISIYEII